MASFSLDKYLEELKQLVNIDSGSKDPEGLSKIAGFFEEKYKNLGWNVERHTAADKPAPCLVITNTPAAKGNQTGENPINAEKQYDVLLLGHMDTVFDRGEAEKRPFRIEGNKAMGPGVADMKSGLLSLYYIIEGVRDNLGDLSVCILLNNDEETGSAFSKSLIRELAARSRCAFGMEPARENGSLVFERKGIADLRVEFFGRAAHAGVEPEKGINAIEAMGHWIVELHKLSKPEVGTTLNVCIASGGNKSNVIPDYASMRADLRFFDSSEVDRIRGKIEEMRRNPGPRDARAEYSLTINRPPMKATEKTRKLQELVEKAAEATGVSFEWTSTGGGSDGNFAAEAGIPVIDGMGPVGGGFHGQQEYLLIDSVEPRINLVKDVILRLKQYRENQ